MNTQFIFLIGGLANTQSILKQLDVSRFAKNSIINLQKIDKRAERKLIYCWIFQRGGANKNDPNIEKWIDVISEQTQQWASHIKSYGLDIIRCLQESKGVLNDTVFNEILIKGQSQVMMIEHMILVK